jgi:hypothetical protein
MGDPAVQTVATLLLARDGSAPRLAHDAISTGHGGELVAEMLRIGRKDSDDTGAVNRVMACLESLPDEVEFVRGYLMALLDPIASHLYMHDVSDAILLWFAHGRSAELAAALRSIAAEPDVSVRRSQDYAHAADVIERRIATLGTK